MAKNKRGGRVLSLVRRFLSLPLVVGRWWLSRGKSTCEECPLRRTCVYAFDPYNTDGDCLLDK